MHAGRRRPQERCLANVSSWHHREAFESENEFRLLRQCGRDMVAGEYVAVSIIRSGVAPPELRKEY
jgi:hypothetical protein